MPETVSIQVTVNGRTYERAVVPRLLLSDFLRHELALTGTHVGCEHGVCGACTILFDGEAARSCLMFAVQAHGHALTTVATCLADSARRLSCPLEALRLLDGQASTMGFWSIDTRLLRRVLEVRTEKAGVDGPKDRGRSPQIKA